MYWLIGLVFLCSITNAQDSALIKTLEGLPTKEPFDTAHPYQRDKQEYIYILSDKDLYDRFDYGTTMKFYQFEFSKYHILGRRICSFCEAACDHKKEGKPCHRNACEYEWTWEMRHNSRAFALIPSKTSMGHIDAVSPDNPSRFFADTILRSRNDSMLFNWYTRGGGDCFAKFEYQVLKDNFYPALILKETNIWGGCRAGGSWKFTISFQKPGGIKQFSKNTILAEKRWDDLFP